MESKAQARKEKDKLSFNEVKNFDTLKDAVNRVSRPPTGWEKVFANHV